MSERNRRFTSNFPVVMRQGPEMFPATLCNISVGGGCVIGSYKLEKGDTVVLDYAIGQTRATVMWTMARMSGLKFDSQLSVGGLASIRTETGPKQMLVSQSAPSQEYSWPVAVPDAEEGTDTSTEESPIVYWSRQVRSRIFAR